MKPKSTLDWLGIQTRYIQWNIYMVFGTECYSIQKGLPRHYDNHTITPCSIEATSKSMDKSLAEKIM